MKNYIDYGIVAPDVGNGEYRTVCPECEPGRKHQGNKDLSVNLTESTWYCHHCGFTGGLGNDQTNGTKYNGGRKEAKVQPAKHEKIEGVFVVPDLQPLSEAGLQYLSSRGITEETAIAAGIKSAGIYFHKLGKPGAAIAFPVYRSGKIVNVKYRCIEKKDFNQSKGGDQTALFNGDSLPGNDTVIFTEGEFDTLAVLEAGYPGVVSCPNGAPPPEAKNIVAKLAFIAANRTAFNAADRIILAMDKDEPGLAFEKLLAEQLGAEKCFTVEYPAGCKDCNDVLIQHGRSVLINCLDNAKPYPVNGITTFDAHDAEILHFWETGGREDLFSTGLNGVDKFLKLQIGTLNILTGIPSHGKSEFLDQIIINTIRLHGWRWTVFSPENYPITNYFQKLAEKWTGKPLFNPGETQRWSIPAMAENEWREASAELSRQVKILTVTETGTDIDSILARVQVCICRDKIKAFVLDPWNEIEHKRPVALSETEYISQTLSQIRNFARLHNVSAWIVAHPAKLVKDKSGSYPIPTPYDISGSAHWRNKADVCLCVWRDVEKNDGVVKLYIQKVRNKNAGRPETVNLHWTRANGIISDEKRF
jgi:twinkle protein